MAPDVRVDLRLQVNSQPELVVVGLELKTVAEITSERQPPGGG